MRSCLSLLSHLLVATYVAPAAAEAPCEPATEGPGVAAAPAPWRTAIGELVRSTAEAGHPWSCGGGSIDVRMHGDAATMIVLRRSDAPIEREVGSPEDLVPMGQALLSLPRAVQVAPAPSEPNPPVAAVPAAARTGAPPPRLVLGARLGPRVAGGADRAFMGGGLSAAVPLGAWSPFVWGRYDSAIGGRRPGLDELCIGGGLARAMPLAGFELTAAVTASAAVMQRDLPRPAGGETRIDARGGLLGGVAVPVHRAWRVIAAVDAEIAPGRSREAPPRNDAGVSPSPFPFFTLGAAAGVELAL